MPLEPLITPGKRSTPGRFSGGGLCPLPGANQGVIPQRWRWQPAPCRCTAYASSGGTKFLRRLLKFPAPHRNGRSKPTPLRLRATHYGGARQNTRPKEAGRERDRHLKHQTRKRRLWQSSREQKRKSGGGQTTRSPTHATSTRHPTKRGEPKGGADHQAGKQTRGARQTRQETDRDPSRQGETP